MDCSTASLHICVRETKSATMKGGRPALGGERGGRACVTRGKLELGRPATYLDMYPPVATPDLQARDGMWRRGADKSQVTTTVSKKRRI